VPDAAVRPPGQSCGAACTVSSDHGLCRNDPEHGPAFVGINPPSGVTDTKAWWVCMECFNEHLLMVGEVVQVIERELRP
jgi:hypothetical protein